MDRWECVLRVKESECLSHHILLQEWGHNLLLCSRNLTRAGNCISFVHMTLRVGVIVRMCMCVYVCVEHHGEASTGGLGKPATAGLSLTAFEGCEGWLIFQSKAVVWREGLEHCSTTSQALP